MPSAYAEKKDKEKAVREDIGGLMAELSRRPQGAERTRKLTGPERAAVLMLSLGEQYGAKIFSLLDDDELREISIVMSSLGTIEAESRRAVDAGIRKPHVSLLRIARQLRCDRAPPQAVPAARARRGHHG